MPTENPSPKPQPTPPTEPQPAPIVEPGPHDPNEDRPMKDPVPPEGDRPRS